MIIQYVLTSWLEAQAMATKPVRAVFCYKLPFLHFSRNQTECELPGAESRQSDAEIATKWLIVLLAGVGIIQEVLLLSHQEEF